MFVIHASWKCSAFSSASRTRLTSLMLVWESRPTDLPPSQTDLAFPKSYDDKGILLALFMNATFRCLKASRMSQYNRASEETYTGPAFVLAEGMNSCRSLEWEIGWGRLGGREGRKTRYKGTSFLMSKLSRLLHSPVTVICLWLTYWIIHRSSFRINANSWHIDSLGNESVQVFVLCSTVNYET